MITSTSNQRIKEARKLQRKRQRQASGQLLIEGTRLVGDALAAGVTPSLVFFDTEAAQGNDEVAALLSEMSPCEQIACAPHVFAGLAETVSPQGIAAVVPLPRLDVRAHAAAAAAAAGSRARPPATRARCCARRRRRAFRSCSLGRRRLIRLTQKPCARPWGAHFRLPLRSGDWPVLRREIERVRPLTDFFLLRGGGRRRRSPTTPWTGARRR